MGASVANGGCDQNDYVEIQAGAFGGIKFIDRRGDLHYVVWGPFDSGLFDAVDSDIDELLTLLRQLKAAKVPNWEVVDAMPVTDDWTTTATGIASNED